MGLYYMPASPFVRKITVVAAELGINDQIEWLKCDPGPVRRDGEIIQHNPLGQVPTLLTDDAGALFDSRVICEYLDHRDGRNLMFPTKPGERWRALCDQSIGDGILDAAILVRYEEWLRPEKYRWSDWAGGQVDKIFTSIRAIEDNVDALGSRVDIGTLTIAISLGYLDFRFDRLQWRKEGFPRTAAWFAEFSKRPSMVATMPWSDIK